MPSYTVAKKIEVIRWHREHRKNVHQISRKFKLDRKRGKRISTISCRKAWKSKTSTGAHGTPVFREDMDDALFEREKSGGRADSNQLLSEEAVKIANSMQLGNLVASTHYINRWKQQFSIPMHHSTNESQRTSEESAVAVSTFQTSANSLRWQDYTLHNITNMDQTVRINNPVNGVNNVGGESTIRIANTRCSRRGSTS
ncbi:hypothetical protein HPB48_021868 [Haemaphysalis longicornis]|uniref:HTH CENPB-type domain-containing protein n=1 Tax=Haemaphysalis longicornis TaxID=44386 RepID=A0A9J6FE16_HAELO|nr:hypothetical protein HPB48_021868 [Haemaphysalis longicornis]